MDSIDADPLRIILERKFENLFLRKVAYRKGWQSPTHWHESARFVFVLNGAFSEKYAGGERECVPFSVIFRPPAERHSEVYHGTGVVCVSVDISPRWAEQLGRRIRLGHSNAVHSPGLAPLILKLNEELSVPDDVSGLAVECLLIEAAIALHRSRTQNGSHPGWMPIARDFIHENAASKLTLEMIAGAAGVHKVHLARTFRQEHHCTVAEYVRRLRIDRARSQLASSQSSIAHIATDAGFSDQSHFSRIFKRSTGVTPAQYRRNLGR